MDFATSTIGVFLRVSFAPLSLARFYNFFKELLLFSSIKSSLGYTSMESLSGLAINLIFISTIAFLI